MAKKVASPELQARMRSAIAMIGRGVNQNKPEMELEGRRLLAVARIENEILIHAEFLRKEDLRPLASILFGTPDDDLDDEDYTADAVETNAEALARSKALDERAKELEDHPLTALDVPDDARALAPPLRPTKEERIAAMRSGYERERAQYPQPELLDDPDDIE
ncbi:hypothetical protein SEA_LIZZ_103 [Streptomyces phage Lizz]|nr:hypothetical protein SEA_LIZZ_103 [Streptomyces phage Lizz]